MSTNTANGAEEWQRAFGEQLRLHRKKKGLSQMALGHRADLDPTYISSVEQGRRNIGLVNICLLAEALNISPAAFFPGHAPSVDCPQ